jgi:ribose transport system permease protein
VQSHSEALPRSGGWIGRIATPSLSLILRNPLIVGLAIMVAYFTAQSSGFLTWDNWKGILLSAAVLSVVAVPQALLVIAGYLDLSVGSVLGMTGVLAGYLMVESGWSPVPASLAAIGVGAAFGLINGYLVCWLGFSAIIVTLGMLTVARGTTLMVTQQTVAVFDEGFVNMGTGELLGVPIPALVALAVFVAGAMFLTQTPWGRHAYALGVNREAAYLSGLPIRGLPTLLFVVSGAGAALGGLLTIARLDSAPASSLGVGFELTVLTAVLLGGVALSGGRGGVLGVLLGVLFLGVLQNGLAIMNVQFEWQMFASGVALIVAAGLQAASDRVESLGGWQSAWESVLRRGRNRANARQLT